MVQRGNLLGEVDNGSLCEVHAALKTTITMHILILFICIYYLLRKEYKVFTYAIKLTL